MKSEVNDRPMSGLVDTRANRSLIDIDWLNKDFTEVERRYLDRHCKSDRKLNIFDAQGNRIDIVSSYIFNVRHSLSNTRRAVFDVWSGGKKT